MLTPKDDLQKCLDAARPGEVIELGEGEYRCKVMVTVPGLTIKGAGAGKTRIVWDDYAKKLDEEGREYITFRTWTVAVCADGVTITDLTIENDAGKPEEKGQEVALTVYADLHPGHPVFRAVAQRPYPALRRLSARHPPAGYDLPPELSGLPHRGNGGLHLRLWGDSL